MKYENCVTGQRVIVKANTSGVPKGTLGIILDDSGVPFVKLIDHHVHIDNTYYRPMREVDRKVFSHVVTMSRNELKKDKSYDYLEDVSNYAL